VENIVKGEINSGLVLYDDSLKDEYHSPKLYQSPDQENGEVPYVLRQVYFPKEIMMLVTNHYFVGRRLCYFS
jgi:hypothetical protein